MENNPKMTPASTIETVDTGLFEWVQNLNLHTTTNKGFMKTFVLWLGTERTFQIKNDQRIRDLQGNLILPLATVNRTSISKDPSFKGGFQAHLPGESGASSLVWKKEVNQEINSKFQAAENYKETKGTEAGKPAEIGGVVYNSYITSQPVYLTMMYEIVLRAEYQQQMNDLMQPFFVATGQINSFLFSKDGHRYEAFIEQEFSQNDTVANLAEQERIFETKVTIKVLGYLVGEGVNDPKPQAPRRENRARIRWTRERTMVGDKIPHKDKDNDYRD